jgi:hypothetical protein
MRYAGIITITVSLLFSGCATSPTIELQKRYQRISSAEMNSLSLEELGWLASGYMRGRVSIETYDGFRYYMAIPRDPIRAYETLSEAAGRGHNLSAGLLGILYRQGVGTERNLDLALDLLSSNHKGYFDLTSEYGLALYEKSKVSENEADLQKAVDLLKFGDRYEYLPATNVLREHYSESNPDGDRFKYYKERSEQLARKKIAVAEAFADSQRRLHSYSAARDKAAANFNRWAFVAMLSVGALVSYQTTYEVPCNVNCSPPSVVDLINWGVL